jgi:hypothetical protein
MVNFMMKSFYRVEIIFESEQATSPQEAFRQVLAWINNNPSDVSAFVYKLDDFGNSTDEPQSVMLGDPPTA